ncbi:hypothetical protein EYS14_19105 [Alteromonadaceae bacterium M269]|nr:hypothetical protein EYS14_19105 [Alteromonadaceae bacterium M269]
MVWKEKTVSEITAKTSRGIHSHASTQFEVKSTGIGSGAESGRWYLNSGVNYRSSYSLNVHLSPKVAEKFANKYNVKDPSELLGKTIQVKGTAQPTHYCVVPGCPPMSAVGQRRPKMYIQAQLLVTDLSNISLL